MLARHGRPLNGQYVHFWLAASTQAQHIWPCKAVPKRLRPSERYRAQAQLQHPAQQYQHMLVKLRNCSDSLSAAFSPASERWTSPQWSGSQASYCLWEETGLSTKPTFPAKSCCANSCEGETSTAMRIPHAMWRTARILSHDHASSNGRSR